MNIIFEILLCFNIQTSMINIIITHSMKKVFDTIKQQKLSATDYFGNYSLQALDTVFCYLTEYMMIIKNLCIITLF